MSQPKAELQILGGSLTSEEDLRGENLLCEAKYDAKVILADVVSSTVLLKGKLRKGGHGN